MDGGSGRQQLAAADPVLVHSPHAALTGAPTAGVPLFTRCPPVHSVLLGPCQLEVAGRRLRSADALALPAHAAHRILALDGTFACVAYLDPRRYSFESAQHLADAWRGFVPGSDDLREAFGDALVMPRRRVDRRVLGALDALEHSTVSVTEAAAQVGLSDSRLTHLMSDALGAPPRAFRVWFKLRRAIGEVMRESVTLTEAAHRAGFADSAHLTRTCKQLTGVRPAQMMPRTVHIMSDE